MTKRTFACSSPAFSAMKASRRAKRPIATRHWPNCAAAARISSSSTSGCNNSTLDGMGLLEILKVEFPEVPVIMISGHGNIETAVTAIKNGAYDFIEKPFKSDRLLLTIERALEAARLRREVEELKQRAGGDGDLIGSSQAILQLRLAIERVAPTGSRVLFAGPPGSGKEVAARLLHRRSKRASGPFVVLNCATMHPDRLETELFGLERSGEGEGAAKIGFLEQAHGGTLLLDEVADMPLETQGKILRVLQEQTFERVGGKTRVEVDVRVIAATARDLQSEMTAGRFRQDLFYRLNVVPMRLPPLKERRDDIVDLLDFFMSRASEQTGLPARSLAEDAVAVLQAYEWPGNVRQLRNVIDWILIMTGGAPDEADPRRHAAARYRLGLDRTRRDWRGDRGHVAAAARGARDLRAALSGKPGRPFRRQHLPHGAFRRHGTLGAPPQAALARHQHQRTRRRPQIRRLTGTISSNEDLLKMGRLAYVNGRYVPHQNAMVHIEDRGYQFADGVYEVVPVVDGVLIDEEPHLDRLGYSLRELRIAWPVRRPVLKLILRELVAKNGLKRGLVYFQVTPRRGAARSQIPDGHQERAWSSPPSASTHRAQRCCNDGVARLDPAGYPLDPARHQIALAAAQHPRQAGGGRSQGFRSLAGRPGRDRDAKGPRPMPGS